MVLYLDMEIDIEIEIEIKINLYIDNKYNIVNIYIIYNRLRYNRNIIMSGVKLASGRNSLKKSYKANLKTIEKIKLKDDDNINHYLPPKQDAITPKQWELSNRKTFYNWLNTTFAKYDSAINTKMPHKDNTTIYFYRIQRLVRDFIQETSPARGLLLYHGLGTGKTCAAMAITEGMATREVIFVSKASLETNFVNNGIYLCGSEAMKAPYHHWVFIHNTSAAATKLADALNIPNEILKLYDGFYAIDYREKTPNYNELPDSHRERVAEQIQKMLDKRFKFLHIDDTRISRKIHDGMFDGKLVIIDEAHNLTSSMTSGGSTGSVFYNALMMAKNAKIILITGTPIINNVFETTKIYNILRGYMHSLVFTLTQEYDKNINWTLIQNEIKKNPNTDQVIIDKIRRTIKVSKNPDGFINTAEGLAHAPTKSADFDKFTAEISQTIKDMTRIAGFAKYVFSLEKNTCLPEDEKEFNNKFYNVELNKIKKPDVFRKRIAGLTSYYEKLDKENFPELRIRKLELIPMSPYQLAKYQPFRHEEIEKNRRQARKNNDDDNISSSVYRLRSRIYCSFAFPEEIGSPYDDDNLLERLENYEEKQERRSIHIGEEAALSKKDIKTNETLLKELTQKIMKELDKNKHIYLAGEKLAMYAPKYAKIIENIALIDGCCLVYSQFITNVGLNTFSYALDATGEYAEFKIIKVGSEYKLDMTREEMEKKHYIFFAGETEKETREIYRLIYNSNFEELLNRSDTRSMAKILMKYYGADQNLHGKIIKIFMTTRAGAEGVDLKHIRQIHIMEPYWQPVLIQQVIGRGIRNKSHIRLPPEERFVDVYIYMATLTEQQIKSEISGIIRNDIARHNVRDFKKAGKPITSDEYLYITAERKLEIIEETQRFIKESAFDCTLNFSDNSDLPQNNNVVCLNYDSNYNRENANTYITTPNINDNIDLTEYDQEIAVITNFQEIDVRGKKYWKLLEPQKDKKDYLYGENPAKKIKMPSPVGEIKTEDGKVKIIIYKKK